MKSVLQVAKEIMNIPTAPYREGWVLNYIEGELRRLQVPYFIDRWGNIIAGVNSPLTLKTSRRVALVAHTDHPGFHLQKKINKRVWQAKWYGGCPPLIKNAAVWIYLPHRPGITVRARILETALNKDKTLTLEVKKEDEGLIPLLNKDCFGAFAFAGFLKKGTRIFTRVADDFAGVITILSTFERLSRDERRHILGIFTRAEETGFKGALGFLYETHLGPENLAISLEASRALVGARIGQGPVIRLGDKKSLFDSGVTALIDLAAENLVKKGAKIQRKIMNGGTCEATAFNFHGIRSGGLAVPLGNYHNQKKNGKPGPEFIDLKDLETEVALCVAFYKLRAQGVDPVAAFVKNLRSEFSAGRPLLSAKIKFKSRDLDDV